jgi:hypothetical protein
MGKGGGLFTVDCTLSATTVFSLARSTMPSKSFKLSPPLQGGFQGWFDGPAVPIHPGEIGPVINPKVTAPVLGTLGYAINSDEFVSALVDTLLRPQLPNAVPGLIVAVVVDPIKGVFRGGLAAQINQEVVIGLPALTDQDAPATVVVVSGVVWILAPPEHVRPG